MKGLPPSADRMELERIWRSYAPPAPNWEDLEDPVALAQRYVDLKMYSGYRFNTQGRIILDFARFLKGEPFFKQRPTFLTRDSQGIEMCFDTTV